MRKIDNKAFTLVELIVTITILAILGTIWFLSVQNYTIYARDVTRVTDLNNIKSVLEYSYTESWRYAEPDSFSWITFSWATAWKQWEFWKKARRATKRLNEVPVDPLTGNKYTYSKLENWAEYELWAVFEWDEVVMWKGIIGDFALADSSNFKAYVSGNYNWKILKVSTWSTDYILAIPSIITTDISTFTVESIISNNSFVIRWTKNLPKSYGWSDVETDKFVNENKYVIFEWNIKEDLWWEEDTVAQELIITKLVEAYSWSLTAERNSDIQNLVDTPTSNNLFVAQTLLKSTVNKKISITSSSNTTPSTPATITDWRNIDPNCDLADVTIWTQTWAGCNSTIWTWVEYTWNWSCYNYQWANIWWTSCYWFDTAESSYNSTYWVNNIWWKLYTWDNSSSACTTWYRVPSDTEWTTLTNYLEWNKWDNNIWWAWHSIQNSTNNIVEALKLPLAGLQLTDGSTFYYRGYYTHLWSSTPSGSSAYYRYLFWNHSTVDKSSGSKAYSFSVRCIKD